MVRGRLGDEHGFTMLGTITAAVLLVFVLGIAASSVISSQKVLGQGTSMTSIDLDVGRLFGTLILDLQATGPNVAGSADSDIQFDHPAPSDPNFVDTNDITWHYVKFKKVERVTFSGGTPTVVWSTPIEYWFEYASPANGYAGTAENAKGNDRNNNGLQGEGVLKRRQDGRTQIIARNVLGRSIEIRPDGSGKPEVSVTIEIATRLNDKSIFTRKITEKVMLRN